jgi:hypothetical protein
MWVYRRIDRRILNYRFLRFDNFAQYLKVRYMAFLYNKHILKKARGDSKNDV